MIQSIHITNSAEDTLNLVLRTSLDTHGILVFNLEGLGSPKATVTGLSGPTYDGVRGAFVRTDARHILLTLAIPARGDIEETAREKVYEFFPVKEDIVFKVITDVVDSVSRYVIATVESVEMHHFSKVENAVISLYCAEPYFMDLYEVYTWARYAGTVHDVVYDGTIPVGGSFTIYFPSPCGDWLTLTNNLTGETMELDFTPIGGEGAIDHGERILIHSRLGEKSITHWNHDYESSANILKCLDPTSDWIKFRPGDNEIVIASDTLGTPDTDRPNPAKLIAYIPFNERHSVDPVIEWHDGKIFALIGNDNIGVYTGYKLYPASREFIKDKDAHLYGPVDIELRPTANFSINFWIFPTSTPTVGERIILSNYEDSQNGFEILHHNSGKVQAKLKVSGTEYIILSPYAAPEEAWTMFSVRHQVASGPFWRITSNSLNTVFTACPAAIGSYTSRWSIGGISSTQFFEGRIQALSLHDDLAVSDAEMAWLYRSGWGRTYAELSGYFSLETKHRPTYQGV